MIAKTPKYYHVLIGLCLCAHIGVAQTELPFRIDAPHSSVSCQHTEDVPPAVLSAPNLAAPYSLDYQDTYHALNCTPQGWNEYFALSRWEEAQNYGDGGVDVTGAPNSVLVEGANSASIIMVPGSKASYRIVLPAEGFILFDWGYIGGSPFENIQFSIHINGRLVERLSERRLSHTFVSPALNAGDELQLKAQAPPHQGFKIKLANFEFISDAMAVIERHWSAHNSEGRLAERTQYISIEKPDFSKLIFPSNFDGWEQPVLPASASLDPAYTGYPVIDEDGMLETTGDQIVLQQEQYGIQASWEDEMSFTNGQCTVYRHWTVRDYCGENVHYATQTLKASGGCPTLLPGAAEKPAALPAEQQRWEGPGQETLIMTDKSGLGWPVCNRESGLAMQAYDDLP